MAVRDVLIRISVDDAGAIAKLDALSARLDKLKAKFDDLSKKVISPTVKTDGITKANAELDKFKANLLEVGRMRAVANVGVDVNNGNFAANVQRAMAQDRRDIAAMAGDGGRKGPGFFRTLGRFGGSMAGKGGWASLLGLLGIGGGGTFAAGGGGGAAAGGGGGLAGILGSPLGVGGILAALPSIAALLDALVGQGVGSGVGAVAFAGANKYDKPQLAPGLGMISGALGNVFKAVGPSIGMMLASLGKFLSTPGMQTSLSKFFSASLPFIEQFIKLGMQAAKIVLPALTAVMKQMVQSGALTAMTQGFIFLIQGITGFIKALGPGFKAGALVFRAIAMGIRGVLYGLGDAFGFLGKVAGIEYNKIHDWWDKLRHNTAVIFDGIRHETAHVWDMIYQDTIGKVVRIYRDVNSWEQRMRHDIASTYDSIRHTISSAWDSIVNTVVNFVTRIYHDVLSWFNKIPSGIKTALGGLPGVLFGIGASALTGMLHGLRSVGGQILGYVAHLGSSIAGALAGAVPGAGLVGGLLHHFGFASGGIITEPIIGHGLRSGAMYTFGEGGIHERVTPLGSSGASGGNINIYVSGDFANPDATALRVVQAIRKYKQHHGNAALGIA